MATRATQIAPGPHPNPNRGRPAIMEHLCRRQAALDTKKVLQEMAREYQQIADYEDRQQPGESWDL